MPRPDNDDFEVEEEIDLNELEELEGFSPGEFEVETEIWEMRSKQYEAAAEALGLDPDLIYEPANGGDVSVAKIFDKAEVLYLEKMEEAVEALNEEGYNVVLGDGESFNISERPDLMVFRNAAFDERPAVEKNQPEYVFANDYLGNASGVEEVDGYQVVGMVQQNRQEFENAEAVSDIESPDDLVAFRRLS